MKSVPLYLFILKSVTACTRVPACCCLLVALVVCCVLTASSPVVYYNTALIIMAVFKGHARPGVDTSIIPTLLLPPLDILQCVSRLL